MYNNVIVRIGNRRFRPLPESAGNVFWRTEGGLAGFSEPEGLEVDPGFDLEAIEEQNDQVLTLRELYRPKSWQLSTPGVSYADLDWPATQDITYRGAVPPNPEDLGNAPPTVEAGSAQTVTLPDSATLDGAMVSDDGLPDPPGMVATAWSQVSGPGMVSFGSASRLALHPEGSQGGLAGIGDASDLSVDNLVFFIKTVWAKVTSHFRPGPGAVDTTASFSAAGSYVLRLTANDGELSASDELTLTVLQAGGEVSTVEVRVAASEDDAEERTSSSAVNLASTDLDLVYDKSNQTVGMRFNGLAIPPGAAIVNAYLQFQVNETSSTVTSLTIEGEAVDHAAAFTSAARNVSSRARTAASVAWSPAAWTTSGQAGPDQRTPNISPVIQEIVSRPGWSSGNSLVILITGSGARTAEAYEGGAAGAPLLHVEYSSGG
jgi:hypothetical protein